MKTLLLAVGLAIAVPCCSGSPANPADFCNQLARTTCERMYACASGSALDLIKAKYGDTVDQCTAFEQGQLDCANAGCSQGSFSSETATSCLSAYDAETCDNLASGTVPTACTAVCIGSSTPAPDSGDAAAVAPAQAAVSSQFTANSSCTGSLANFGAPDVEANVLTNGEQIDGGTGEVSCSVVPGTDGKYTVSAQASISSSPAKIAISSTFTDSSTQSGIDVDFVAADGTAYSATNCSITYPTKGGIYADAKGGRVWATFVCPTDSGCTIQGAFRFENCQSH